MSQCIVKEKNQLHNICEEKSVCVCVYLFLLNMHKYLGGHSYIIHSGLVRVGNGMFSFTCFYTVLILTLLLL